jgi:hypothetical protein
MNPGTKEAFRCSCGGNQSIVVVVCDSDCMSTTLDSYLARSTPLDIELLCSRRAWQAWHTGRAAGAHGFVSIVIWRAFMFIVSNIMLHTYIHMYIRSIASRCHSNEGYVSAEIIMALYLWFARALVLSLSISRHVVRWKWRPCGIA